MGLFDLFGKKGNSGTSTAKPLESYLEQRDGEELLKEAEKWALYASAGDGCVYFYNECYVQSLSGDMLKGNYSNNPDPIPKCYYKSKVSAMTMLNLAYEKGNAIAAFYLGFLHQHGIGIEQNNQRAKQYYSEIMKIENPDWTAEQAQKLVKATAYIHSEHNYHMPNFGASQMECIAIGIAKMRINSDKKIYERVKGIFCDSAYLMETFENLGALAICHYADKGLPYSRFILASLMDNRDIPRHILHKFNYDFENQVRKCGQKMLIRISKQAVNGDKHLINILEAYDYPYRQVAREY